MTKMRCTMLINPTLALAIVLLLGEVITRLFISSPDNIIPDKDLGWLYRPHSTIFHTTEGWATNTINAFGFNDRDFPAGRYQKHVAVFGDSYTEALQVPREQNFTTVLEDLLTCVNVENMGRSALSVAQYPLLVNRMLDEIPEPVGLVVLAVTTSDVSDMFNLKMEIEYDSVTGGIISLVPERFELHWLRKKLNVVFSSSALAPYLKIRARSVQSGAGNGLKKNPTAYLEDPAYQSKLAAVLEYAFSSIAAKSSLLIVYIPTLDYLANYQYAQTSGSARFGQLLEEVAQVLDISFVSAKAELLSAYKETGLLPIGFANSRINKGHLNETGHRAVATALYKKLSKTCVSDSRPNI
ncbi:MAG: hypothetical protein KUG79_11490 [Pseudomonadales bacterium]|nr:hypothetical protein [Pseudomonadales bacterium]